MPHGERNWRERTGANGSDGVAANQETDRLEAQIEGRVQGVGFRYFVQREATRLGLNGWVRNLRSGGVQLVAEGPKSDLNSLLAIVRKGPPMAQVQRVDASWKQAKGEFGSFEIKYTI